MVEFLVLFFTSFFFAGVLSIPFINLLYHLKFLNPTSKSVDAFGKKTIFNKLHSKKAGTPTGGGLLVIISTVLSSLGFLTFTKRPFGNNLLILLLTMILFGLLGFVDDLQKFFNKSNKFSGLRIRHKLLMQLVLSAIISLIIYKKLNISFIIVPLLGKIYLGPLYILYSIFFITFFANAFNITDGLDGLAGGLLFICLIPLWYLAAIHPNGFSDSLIISTLLGALLAFLYFNIHPARVFMGDTGALAMGALLAVIALLLNVSIPLFILGGVFVIDGLSSLVQWLSMATRGGKRVFRIAPIHHHFEALGWSEPKVVMRFWLCGIFFAFLGLLFALI